MNELSAEQTEAMIEAAARGQVTTEGDVVGELLVGLHAPGRTVAAPPALTAPATGFGGRFVRRTAVVASSAVLGLASVAAAATGAGVILDDDPTPPAVEEEIVELTVDGGTEDGDASTERSGDENAEAAAGDVGDAVEQEIEIEKEVEGHAGGRPDIEGVDPSDGLDDEELELACEGAENHGHYVSLVARDKLSDGEGTHGERVSEAAQSDCGKDDEVEGVEDDEEVEEVDATEEDEEDDEIEAADENDRPGNGNGNGHDKAKGNGHGQGNGNGNGQGNGNGHDRD